MTDTAKKRANWRTPDATRVEVDEATERLAWLKERRNGIGGTDAAALMGVHVTTAMSTAETVTPAHVYLDKVDEAEPVEDDKAIFAFGHLLEAELMRQAAERFDITTRPGGFFRNIAEPWRCANPDALASDGGIVEGKTVSNRAKHADAWRAGDVSDHAYIQTQHYLAVTGRSHSYYSVAIRDDYTNWEAVPRALWTEPWFADMAVKEFVQVGPVPRDEAVIAALLDVEREWWGYITDRHLPPAMLGHLPPAVRFSVGIPDLEIEAAIPAMTRDDVTRLRAIKAQQTQLDSQRKAIEKRLQAAIGSAEYLTVNGKRVARWQTTNASKFDKSGLAAEHPDLVAAHTTRGTQRRFSLPGGNA